MRVLGSPLDILDILNIFLTVWQTIFVLEKTTWIFKSKIMVSKTCFKIYVIVTLRHILTLRHHPIFWVAEKLLLQN